jgi:hypothetical protein
MDVVENYLYFKRKWLVKLSYQLSAFYDTPNDVLRWEKTIDEFLEDSIDDILLEKEISDDILEDSVFEINENILNHVDINIFKIVLNTFNKPKYIMSNYSFMNLILISVLLESTLDIYRLSFDNYQKSDVEDILEDNIIGLSFIEYKKKSRKLNLVFSYLEYLNKKQKEVFGILGNNEIRLDLIRLSNEYETYICDYDFRILELQNYDDDIVNEVYEDKLNDKRLFIIVYKLLRLKLLLNKELGLNNIKKVLFILDDNIVNKEVLKEINKISSNKIINNLIVFVSNDINKTYKSNIDIIYYYQDNDKFKNTTTYKDKTLVVSKEFLKNNKVDEKRFINNNIKFIVINDNIKYLFKGKEVESK